MIQFNLLPDVKVDYIRTRRTKRMVTLVATIVAAASLTIMILLFIAVNFVQKRHLDNLSNDIAADSKTLQETPNLDKILTVQNQLNSLPALHDQKPQVTRLNGFLQQVTPANASIADMQVDFTSNSITLSGNSDSLAGINKFVDTLKFTGYQYGETTGQAFNSVVLTSFGIGQDDASYSITLQFDPVIFDSSKEIVLTVPNTVTTRSTTDKPSALFEPLAVPLEDQ